MQNFKEIADAFLANGAAVQVQSERELDEALLTLVTDPVRRARLGAAARALVEANRGAKDKTLAVIAELLPPAGARPSSVPSGWCTDAVRVNELHPMHDALEREAATGVRPAAGDASAAIGLCTARRRMAALVRARPSRRRLARPVISVGNLRVGGSGKTPVVEYIARLLVARGERPAILTRGYARRRARRRRHRRLRRRARPRRPRRPRATNR